MKAGAYVVIFILCAIVIAVYIFLANAAPSLLIIGIIIFVGYFLLQGLMKTVEERAEQKRKREELLEKREEELRDKEEWLREREEELEVREEWKRKGFKE